MRIINVIVHDIDTGIISVDSLGIADEQMSNEVVEQAEQLYIEKCKTIKYGNKKTREQIIANGMFDYSDIDDFADEVTESLDDGYFEVYGVTVSFVWSSIDNVQLQTN